MKEPSPLRKKGRSKLTKAAIIAAAGLSAEPREPAFPNDTNVRIDMERADRITAFVKNAEANRFFDENEQFFTIIPEGEFTETEREKRTKILSNGEEVFEDIGLTFYKVQKGDTLSGIRKNLGAYPEYSYLATQTGYMQSFNNIPEKKLEPDMWLPLPVKIENRELTDAQFIYYADRAVEEIATHPRYGSAVEKILEKTSYPEFLAALTAIAKKESHLGTFELHRYEPKYKVFSYSHYHILMLGPGLKARKTLNLTEGQTYHPINGTKLCIGFIVEKAKEQKKHPEDFFPLPDHYEDFATLYNGAGWKPDYIADLSEFYDETLKELEAGSLEEKK